VLSLVITPAVHYYLSHGEASIEELSPARL
jgi:hypothetical protein